VKSGIIGCGVIAASHLRILQRIRPERSVYLCDIDQSKTKQLAARFPVQGIYSSVDDFLRSEKPDAVHIVTPPHTHAALAEQAILAGCHVFLEKPVTETAEDYVRISQLASGCEKVLCCGYSTLGMPVVIRAMREARSGRLGRLIAVHCSFAGSEPGGVIPYGNSNHWAYLLRGGVLQNMIDHPLSLVIELMDPIEAHSVFVARRNILPYDCPDLIHVSLRSRDQIGSITLSLGHGCNERRAQLLFEGGSIMIDMGRQLYSLIPGRGPQNFVKKALSGISEGYAFAGGTVKNIVQGLTGKLQRDPGIVNVMEGFYKTIETGTGLLASPRVVLALTTLLDDIWNEIDYRPVPRHEEVPL
jgi:predicted dehydrogenase